MAMQPFDDLVPPTEKQMEALKAIYGYWRGKKFYPTQRELADILDISLASAQDRVRGLFKKGYLERFAERAQRNMKLSAKAGLLLGVSSDLKVDKEN